MKKTIYKMSVVLVAVVMLMACEDVSDLAVKRIVAPVALEVEDTAADEVTATIFELDKSGILDHTVGIVSVPVPDLLVEVFAGTVSLGTFTTNTEGKIVVSFVDAKPDGYSGTYKSVKFFIKK